VGTDNRVLCHCQVSETTRHMRWQLMVNDWSGAANEAKKWMDMSRNQKENKGRREVISEMTGDGLFGPLR
jgi:hypothetical protein